VLAVRRYSSFCSRIGSGAVWLPTVAPATAGQTAPLSVTRRVRFGRIGPALVSSAVCQSRSPVSGAGRRRADKKVWPAEYDQGCDLGTAAQPRELSATRARSPSGSPRHRHWDHCPPLTLGPVPDRPQAPERVSIGEGLPMRGCKGSPLRGPRRERRLWQPDRRPRARLREPPRQESGGGLSACHRA
jgi:hypothetical protein